MRSVRQANTADADSELIYSSPFENTPLEVK